MPTIRQKRLAKAIIENSTADEPLNKQELLEKVGYSQSIATTKPTDVIQAIGVQEALAEYGFTEENASKVVTDILLNDKQESQHRLKAADMIFKVKGSYAPERHITVSLKPEASDKVKELAEHLNELHRRGTDTGN